MQKANQPFHYTDPDGAEHFVPKGAVYDDDDAVLKGRESLFDKFETKSSSARK